MNGAVMDAAKRHREFIAGLTAERPWLHVSKMMRVRWLAAADEARLLSDKAYVLAATIAPRGGDREHAVVDPVGVIPTGETLAYTPLPCDKSSATILFA